MSKLIGNHIEGPLLKRPRIERPQHLAFIRACPCSIPAPYHEGYACVGIVAAHVRYGSARWAKVNPGVGQKPDDNWTVPLCGAMHTDSPICQHNAGERRWWLHKQIDPLALAAALWINTGDMVAAHKIIRNAALGDY